MIFRDFEHYRQHPKYKDFFIKTVLHQIGEEKEFTMTYKQGLVDLITHNNTKFVIPNETMEEREERLRQLPFSLIEETAEKIVFPYVAEQIDIYNEMSNVYR